VLFNATNSPELVGKSAYFPGLDEPATFSNHFLRLRPRTVDGRYLARWLTYEFKRGEFRTITRRWVNQAAIDKEELLNRQIPLPSLTEQRRIADIFDRSDALRTKRQQAIALWDRLAESIFFGMFAWTQKSPNADLEDYLTFVTSGSRGWAKYYADSGSRFIRSMDVRMNEIASSDAVYVDPPDNAEAKRTRVSTGDVLLTITGALIGRVAPVPSELAGSYISQHVAILRTDQKRILPEFLAFFLSLPTGGQRQIAELHYGQTKPGLNFEQIGEFRVPAQDITQQRSFVEKLAKIKEIVALHHEHLARLDELFTSLQYRAFGGTL
jgi:type I restriction enzyme S subunit